MPASYATLAILRPPETARPADARRREKFCLLRWTASGDVARVGKNILFSRDGRGIVRDGGRGWARV